MVAKTTKERVAEYAQRMQDQGLMKVCVWVPKDKAEQLRKYAARLKPKPQ